MITAAARLPQASTDSAATSSGSSVRRASTGCNDLSESLGVTTGDLYYATGSSNCTLPPFPICLPTTCNLTNVPENATCDSLAASFSTSIAQLLIWNPNIVGLCDDLLAGQYVCQSAPGGTYVLPPVPPGSNGGAAGAGRGGPSQVGPVNGTSMPTAVVSDGTAVPSPTQSGIAENCNHFVQAGSGDYCYSIAETYQVTLQCLGQWNTILGTNGSNCSTEFWSGYYYCVNVTAVPTPVQLGIASNCTEFVQAGPGDYCYSFAETYQVTLQSLGQWNTILGTNGSNCSTEFWSGYYYCVGVDVPVTTSTSTSLHARSISSG